MPPPAQAQPHPVKPLRLIAPFPTGASQILAHLLSEKLAESLGQPVVVNYRPGGVGSSGHLAGEHFAALNKISMVHVPYKGASIALTNILSGEADIVIVTVPATIPFINAGKLRGLAILDTKRVPQLPQLHTSAEAGMPDLLMTTWYGVATPANVRSDIIARLHKAVVSAIPANEVKLRLASVGMEAGVSATPAEFGEYVRADVARWTKVIREAKIQVD